MHSNMGPSEFRPLAGSFMTAARAARARVVDQRRLRVLPEERPRRVHRSPRDDDAAPGRHSRIRTSRPANNSCRATKTTGSCNSSTLTSSSSGAQPTERMRSSTPSAVTRQWPNSPRPVRDRSTDRSTARNTLAIWWPGTVAVTDDGSRLGRVRGVPDHRAGVRRPEPASSSRLSPTSARPPRRSHRPPPANERMAAREPSTSQVFCKLLGSNTSTARSMVRS